MAVSSRKIDIAPVILISISDHCTRLEFSEEKNKTAIGGLLGEYVTDKEGNVCVKILDCLEAPKDEHGNLEKESVETMIELCQANYPDRELIGYYLAGPDVNITRPKGFPLPVSNSNPLSKDSEATFTRSPSVFLAWNSSPEASSETMAVRIFEIKPDDSIGNLINYAIDQDRGAEMIALTDVLNLECNRTSLTKLKRYQEGVNALLEKAQILLSYIEDVENGKTQQDSSILRGMKSLLSRLPLNSGTGEFSEAMLEDFANSQLYAYLGAMTESSVMIAHNSIATQQAQKRFPSYGFNSRGMH